MEKKEINDQFIKEKLDALNDISKLDYTPPDLTEMNRKISEAFSNSLKKRKPSTKTANIRKKTLIWGLATGALAVVLIGVSIIIGILNRGDDFYYNDDELVGRQYSLTEFQETFDVVLPDTTDIVNSTIIVYRHEEKNVNVYVDIILNLKDGELIELCVVFVENYSLKNESLYNSLPQTEQTDLFSYNYAVIEDSEIAYAKFTHNDYRYYLKLNSETPENIINIVESFS